MHDDRRGAGLGRQRDADEGDPALRIAGHEQRRLAGARDGPLRRRAQWNHGDPARHRVLARQVGRGGGGAEGQEARQHRQQRSRTGVDHGSASHPRSPRCR
jgi:hypothetical protein